MALGNVSPETILRAITRGPMKEQAAGLSPQEKSAVAEFLTGRMLGDEAAAAPLACTAKDSWFDLAQSPSFSGWGLDAGNGHAIPGELAGIDRANVGKLKLKWAFAFPDVLYARSQPTLAGGAIFVGGDDGTVYALDPETGCAHWTFDASGPVRMGIVIDDWHGGRCRRHAAALFWRPARQCLCNRCRDRQAGVAAPDGQPPQRDLDRLAGPA